MHYSTLSALIADRKTTLSKGPVALMLADDSVELESTLTRLRSIGFAQVITFCAPEIALPDGTTRVDYDVLSNNALPDIVNALIAVAPGIWFHYCYNAEYLYFPFCEHRSVGEMIAFTVEERRDVILTYVVDLYAADLNAADDGVSRNDAYLDRSGYYALARTDDTGAALERQMDFFGGLRWRFEEHIPITRRRIDRVSLFRAVPGLQMLPDRSFNIAEHNTYACPWHNNLTAAVCSFRTAKALRRNPGSRHQIDSFHWQNAVPFNWHSQQLLDLGLMEPGQWF
ncbi:hypothetical protein ACJ5NV_13270 [Loktanella agnita]|uniref:hypothetical protein n=1 Tax=Loktanella agnita TaxID=287097 RepID=UPI00398694CB